MRSLIALTTTALIPLSAFLACSSSTTTPPAEPDAATAGDASEAGDVALADTGDAGGGQQCVLVRRFGSERCESCLREKCCTPIQACEADSACKTLHDCVSACLLKPNAAPCIDKCKLDNPAGKPKFDEFDACIAAPPDAPKPGCAFDCSQ